MMHRPTRPVRSCGHTLLELVIAVALGLVVAAGAVAAYRSQYHAFVLATDAARIHDAGMSALTLVGEQIQMAGFAPADEPQRVDGFSIFGCAQGRPTGTDASLTCESLSNQSDGIAVRYVGDTVSTWPSTDGQVTDCLGQGVGAARVIVVNRYYVGASDRTSEPELYCKGSGKTDTPQPVVEGVEALRLRYWLANATQSVGASALTLEQWSSVTAVDLCVQVRGVPFPRSVSYVDCDGVSKTATDGRMRQTFWRHIALRNQQGALS
jgi:type IV pilus assembly protein PilW